MAASKTTAGMDRKWRIRRIFAWTAGLALSLATASLIVRAILVRQMRWPRLTVVQDGCIMAVSVTPDGQTVFSGEGPAYDLPHPDEFAQRNIFVWSAANGRLIRRLPGFQDRSSSVTASPDGKQVIACGTPLHQAGQKDSVIAWNWQTGRKQWGIQNGKSEDFMPFCYSPEGRLVECANNIRLAATGALVCRTSAQGEEDSQSEFTPDGRLFGIVNAANPKPGKIGDADHEKNEYSTTRLHFWHTDTGREAKDFPFTRVRAFDIARSGQWLVMTSDADGMIGGTDGSVVRRVDFQTGKATWTRQRRMNKPDADPNAVLNSVAVSPNGKYVVLASMNSRLIVLDAQTGRELFRPINPPGTTVPDWALPGGLAFSADGKTLVSRCGRRVLVWDASSLQ